MKHDAWDRFSIEANTRPDRLPARVGPSDFLLPSGPRTMSMFRQCGIAAFGIAFFVLGPLVLFVAFTPVESLGRWPWPITGVAWIAGWAGLFVGAVRESRAVQEWLDDQ